MVESHQMLQSLNTHAKVCETLIDLYALVYGIIVGGHLVCIIIITAILG